MVLASGVFDGLHVGHIFYLQQAQGLCEEGELFVVAIASDDYVRTQKNREPRWRADDRAAVVSVLDGVHRVVIHNDEGACDAIRRLKPRLFVKGSEYAELPKDDADACAECETAVAFTAMWPCKHTSDA